MVRAPILARNWLPLQSLRVFSAFRRSSRGGTHQYRRDLSRRLVYGLPGVRFAGRRTLPVALAEQGGLLFDRIRNRLLAGTGLLFWCARGSDDGCPRGG